MSKATEKHCHELPEHMAIPRGEDGDPVFAEPWEARVFGLVVGACDQGKFTWKEFQQLLIEEIRASETQGEPRSYYLNWAIAAEQLFTGLGALTPGDLDQRVAKLRPDDKTVRLD